MRDKVVLKTKPAWARFKMHGFHHNPLCDFQKLGIDLQINHISAATYLR